MDLLLQRHLKHANRMLHKNCAFSKYNLVSRVAATQQERGRVSRCLQAMDMGKVNSMDFREFMEVFGNVIERCPLIAAAVWSQSPFSDWEDLARHFSAFIDALPQSGQEGVLRCYPDLAGHDLHQGTLTAESQREHSVAGLMSLGANEGLRLAELNLQYRARFGFPFVLAARLSDRETVFRELERRLRCPSALELRTALGEVKKIGRLRLADLFGVDPAARL